MAIESNMQYAGSSPADWARHVATTQRKDLRKVSKEMLRGHQLTALIEDNGGVETGLSGRNFSWPVQNKIHDDYANTGLQARNFAPTPQHLQANLEWGGLEVTDSIREREVLENRGKEAIIRIVDTMHSRMKESIAQRFARRLYDDGATTSHKIYGLESIFGVSVGGATNYHAYDWGTNGGTPAMTEEDVTHEDVIMVNDDNYAGLDTDFGAYGGAQTSGGFPMGQCDEEADFWTPPIINSNSVYFGTIGSATGWQDNAPEILRFAITHMMRNSSVKRRLDLFLMDRELLNHLKNQLLGSGAGRPEVGLVSDPNGLQKFGFRGQFQFDNIECTSEYYVPHTTTVNAGGTFTNRLTCYGLCTKAMSFHSAYDDLFAVDPKSGEYDIDTQAYKYAIRMLGQLKIDGPRNFCKIAGYSQTS